MTNKRPQPWTPEEEALLLPPVTSYPEYERMAVQQGYKVRTPGACASRLCTMRKADPSIPEWERGGSRTWPTIEQRDTGRVHIGEAEPQIESRLEWDDEPLPGDESIGFRERLEDEDVRDYWEAQKKAIAAHQRRLEKRSNRVIPHTTDDPEQPFGIFFFGDTHIGSNGILADRMEHEFELMRQACESLGARLVFMGDALENAKIHGKAAPAVYDQGIPPSPQRDVAELLFAPLAPYFLAFLEGNHDSRDAQTGGIGWMAEFAKRIDVPYVSEAGCAIHLTHGFQRYVIYARHDWRGKSQLSKGNAHRRMEAEYPEWENGDVAVLAHLHEPFYERRQMKGQIVHWVRTGSLKVHDSYAARGGFTPEPGTACVIFWPNERRIKVEMTVEDGIERLEDAQRRFRSAA